MSRVRIEDAELGPLREAMRDVQLSVAAYYAETARGGDLGARVRSFLVNAQTLNELFTHALDDSGTFSAITASADGSASVIRAVKYARNVTQHVLYIVRPSDDVRLIGGVLGLRVYALWDEIPPDIHLKLRPGTQKLKVSYDELLRDREVTGTMLDVLRFYAEIAPDIVHRDRRGEWTGFPLMNQPGVSAPLHPEEPPEVTDALAWLDDRPPGGDQRVVCGQLSMGAVRLVFGLTFVGSYSFAPFVERLEQANRDIASGFSYSRSGAAPPIRNATSAFLDALQGSVLESLEEIASWATPIDRMELEQDWCVVFGSDVWERIAFSEGSDLLSRAVAYEVRRSRRLNAFVPPSP